MQIKLPFLGLGYNGNPVPLAGVEVDAKVVEFTAEVTLTQYYFNNQSISLETDYVFPLDEKAAVCGFECIVNGRVITGTVKEKEEAKQEYKNAIQQNKTASLLEQQAADVFQLKIGNIPAYANVVIKLTYVTELENEEDAIVFVVPTSVAPRYTPYTDLYKSIPSSSPSMNNRAALALSLQTVMKSQILAMECPTHVAAFASNSGGVDGKASINLNAALSNDIVIRIQTADLGKPRLVLEQQTRVTEDGAAAMISFIPRFNLDDIKAEFCFVLDCSGSMQGPRIESAKNALQLFLRCLPVDSYFNIVKFGSNYNTLFSSYQAYSQNSLQQASNWVSRVGADMGGTELLQALQSAYTMPGTYGRMRQVFVLTDGEVSNTEQILNVVRSYNKTARTFTLGIGGSVSHALVEGIARAGNGTCQYVVDGEGVQVKLMKQLKSALQPALSDVKVEWVTPNYTLQTNNNPVFVAPSPFQQFVSPPVQPTAPSSSGSLIGHRVVFGQPAQQPVVIQPTFPVMVQNPAEPIKQAPFEFPPLFSGKRVLIYALFASNIPMPQSVKVTAQSPDGPLSIELPLDEFKFSGNQIHTLAARSLIRDLEEGNSYLHKASKNVVFGIANLDATVKNTIISLGKKYQLTSKHTSYIAVDHSSQVFNPAIAYYYMPVVPVPVTVTTTTTTTTTRNNYAVPTSSVSSSSSLGSYGAMPASAPAPSPSFGFGSSTPSSNSSFNAFGGSANPFNGPSSPQPQYAQQPQQQQQSFSFGMPPAQPQSLSYSSPPPPSAPVMRAASRPSAPPSSAAPSSPRSSKLESKAPQRAPAPSAAPQMMDMDLLCDISQSAAPSSVPSDPFDSFASMAKPISSSDTLMSLISLQNFDGSFPDNNNILLSLLGLNPNQISSFAQTFQSALQLSSLPAGVLLTAIVIAFIESRFSSRKDEWELAITKSKQFIRSKVSASIDQVVSQAKMIF